MSNKLDQLARDLLEKTRQDKLDWRILANPYGRDWFQADLQEGYRFGLWESVSGESRSISLRLEVNGHAALESVANNWPEISGGVVSSEAVVRFRLYSDLFDAVRESVYGKEEVLGKVQELLRKIS